MVAVDPEGPRGMVCLDDAERLPLVEVHLGRGGAPFAMVVDTGADRTLLTRAAAMAARVDGRGLPDVAGASVTGGFPVRLARLDRLQVANGSFRDLVVGVLEGAPLVRAAEAPFGGFLGADVLLAAPSLALDLGAGDVGFGTGGVAGAVPDAGEAGGGGASHRTPERRGGLVVAGSITGPTGRVRFRARLDTGAARTAVSSEIADSAGILYEAVPGGIVGFAGAGPPFHLEGMAPAIEALGTRLVPSPLLVFGPTGPGATAPANRALPAVLGFDLLDGLLLAVDTGARRARLGPGTGPGLRPCADGPLRELAEEADRTGAAGPMERQVPILLRLSRRDEALSAAISALDRGSVAPALHRMVLAAAREAGDATRRAAYREGAERAGLGADPGVIWEDAAWAALTGRAGEAANLLEHLAVPAPGGDLYAAVAADLDRAVALLHAGRPDAAEGVWRPLRGAPVPILDAWVGLGWASEQRGDAVEAARHYLALLAAAPSHPGAWRGLLRTADLGRAEDRRGVDRALRSAAALGTGAVPPDVEAELVRRRGGEGRAEARRRAFAAWTAALPDDVPRGSAARRDRSRLWEAAARGRAEGGADPEGAIRWIDAALALDPGGPSLLDARALVLHRAGRRGEAREAARLALLAEPFRLDRYARALDVGVSLPPLP
ncbi:retroviral-like aspartic protease family protein [Myxococcota bacterium]|nr:retroviral-like aspartic protease family protein [Myxococcota bacterium]